MAEKISKQQRSLIMKAVKSRNARSTELTLVQIFKEFQIKGWRRTYKLFGSPDFVFPKKRIALFCDGCFWHGHTCRKTKPATNVDYWKKKIQSNKNRDKLVTVTLTQINWKVIRLWECEIKNHSLPVKLKLLHLSNTAIPKKRRPHGKNSARKSFVC